MISPIAEMAKQRSMARTSIGGKSGNTFAGINRCPIRPMASAGTKTSPVAHSFQPNSAKDILAIYMNRSDRVERSAI
jgi:hypothetical protein